MTNQRRPVPDWNGLDLSEFEADTDGKVYRNGREVGARQGGYVAVWIGQTQRMLYRHQMVCLAFHGLPVGERCQVAHYNDIKGDDRPENLRWATALENRRDAKRNGRLCSGERRVQIALASVSRGEDHSLSKLTEADVVAIRELYAAGDVTHTGLAKRFGITRPAVSNICTGKAWRHAGGPLTVNKMGRPARVKGVVG